MPLSGNFRVAVDRPLHVTSTLLASGNQDRESAYLIIDGSKKGVKEPPTYGFTPLLVVIRKRTAYLVGQASSLTTREGEAPAEPFCLGLGGSLALPR